MTETKDETISKLENKIERMQKGHLIEMVSYLNALKEKFGEEVVATVTAEVIKKMKEHWAQIAEQAKDNSISSLVRCLWEPLKEIGFEYSHETTKEGTQMHVTKCTLADLCRELGCEDWGYHLYCMSDYGIVEGFNPEIEFKRTKTLMEGDDCCDHFYCMKE
jgi:predicted ArsR family transcriptional regulator